MATNGAGLNGRFKDVITSESELREILGSPSERAAAKVIPVVDEFAARFIAASPFVLIASANARGEMDLSPKGDPAGFVKLLDEKTIAVPDRLGNRRIDTFRNILENPDVALIFLIPGVSHTLRVSGKAAIVRDRALRETMAVNGKLPDHTIVVAVERVLSHCPKCMIRSHLWQPDEWRDPEEVPSLAEILVAHAKLAETVDDVQAVIDNDAVVRLY
ncbi:MAG: MSMEG_1061 family FMN-dependent PPOX-type flavoprotein [Propylenella sp.]